MTREQRREFLAKANTYKPTNKNHRVIGRYASEKLDGTRCFWDGGVSRGRPKTEIPWANNDKDERYLTPQIATGLWSMYGNVIHAPNWYLDTLPVNLMLDGEIWFGYNSFQQNRKIVSCSVNPKSSDWKGAMFKVWSEPNYHSMFTNEFGTVKNSNFTKDINCLDWVLAQGIKQLSPNMFVRKQLWLQENLPVNDNLSLVKQVKLGADYEKVIFDWLDLLDQKGGEGLILTDPSMCWRPKRSNDMLKVKFVNDEDAKIIGCYAGKITDKESRLRGMMGAMYVEWKGKHFKLSGFTDQERKFNFEDHRQYAWNNPGGLMVKGVLPYNFKLGDTIPFMFRELSDDGIPKEARYHRKK